MVDGGVSFVFVLGVLLQMCEGDFGGKLGDMEAGTCETGRLQFYIFLCIVRFSCWTHQKWFQENHFQRFSQLWNNKKINPTIKQ